MSEETALDTVPEHVLTGPEIELRIMERQAAALSRARMAIPKAYVGNAGDIFAVMLMARELGVSAQALLRSSFIVGGKVQLMGDMLLAIARANGVKVTEVCEEFEGALIASCTAELPSGEKVMKTYSEDDAKRAGLWESSDAWKKYPKRMLQMRARGWTLRDAIPDKLAGVYAEGELIDVTPTD